jgi:hypothetical protein
MIATLVYLVRGNPVIYYGDEQGFVGDGGDQDARQDMFPSQVATYNDDDNIDRTHPLYRRIRRLAALTKYHPALRDGAVQKSSVPTYSGRQSFGRVYGDGPDRLRSERDASLDVLVQPLSAVVYRSSDRVDRSHAAPSVSVSVDDSATVRGRLPVVAAVSGDSFYQTTFYQRVGSGGWKLLGTDDNAPYRVFPDVSGLAVGTEVQFLAAVKDNAGHVSRARSTATVPAPPPPVTTATVHYQRTAGDYDSWGLHLWGDAVAEGVATAWDAPRQRDGVDGYGAVYRIPLRDGQVPVNFIVHTPSGDVVPSTREPGGDRSFVPAEHAEIWLLQGDPTVYFEDPTPGR